MKELYFLFTAETASDKPCVRCTVHRGDGVKIVYDWISDGKGGFTTSPGKNLTTEVVWQGQCKIHRRKSDMLERSVFMTTWKNDNEWLPVTQIDFERLDRDANVAIFGVTGLK